jgi:hypothetical protein
MKTILYSFLMGLFMLAACNSKKSETKSASGTDTGTATETKSEDGQSTPDGAASMIFAAASSGDYSKLKGMCDPALETDKDSKMICEVPDGDDDLKNMFKEHFSKGKVVGAPTIEGDDAKVNITFGPDGSKEETFNFKKKDGKWYIVSF